MGTFKAKIARAFCFCCLIQLISISALADSWTAPHTFEETAGNGKFIAVIVPAQRGKPGRPTLEVFKLEDQKRASQWRVELSNAVSPMEALVTDDGQYAVTLDNHARVGYGDDVVAIYGKIGQIKKYSMETIAGELVGNQRARGMWDLFPHSTSSRWWRQNSISSLEGAGDEARFALWLPWAHRWCVWKLSDGTIEKLDKDALKKWNDFGSRWAHAQLEELKANQRRAERLGLHDRLQENPVTACQYLGFLKSPDDRKLLESLLQSEDADIRSAADKSLAMLDGADLKVDENFEETGVSRLGTVKVDVKLPHKPADFEGTFHTYIFPDSVKVDAWRDAWPAYYSGVRFASISESAIDVKATAMKPGRYWVKVIWDRKHRGLFDVDMSNVRRVGEKPPTPVPGPDDFESAPSKIFDLKPGQALEVKIDCDRPGAKK